MWFGQLTVLNSLRGSDGYARGAWVSPAANGHQNQRASEHALLRQRSSPVANLSVPGYGINRPCAAVVWQRRVDRIDKPWTTRPSTCVCRYFCGAVFRTRKAAIIIHTLMDLEGEYLTFIHISDGKANDMKILDMIPILAGSIYIMARGYLNFERLNHVHNQGSRFVIRAKKNLLYYQKSSTPVDSLSGLQ